MITCSKNYFQSSRVNFKVVKFVFKLLSANQYKILVDYLMTILSIE